MSLSFNEIKDLIGKPGVKLRMRGPFGIDVIEGDLIGVLEQPSVILRCDDGIQHHFAAEMAYELVEPPLPPEPDAPAVMLGGRVWVRQGFPGDYHYEAPGFHGRSWLALSQLSNGVPIVPLVPDPVASAPELPFRAEDQCGDKIEVNCSGRFAYVYTAGPGVDLDPDTAEQVAYAILRAAHEARVAS